MSEQIYKRELTKLIGNHTGSNGTHATAIPSLFFSRYSNLTGPSYGVYKPSLCIVVQGMKEVLLGQERYTYGPANYLVASVNLPITGQVTEASSEVPYLALKIEFSPNQILDVMRDSQIGINQIANAKRGMYVSQIEPSLLDAVTRLVRLIDNPTDIPVLAPLITKEIIYRVLHGEHGVALGQIAIEGSSTYQVNDVIEYIMNNYERSFRTEELAEIGNMSVSSLHRHFKEVTAMSPIQFQKQDATEAAFRVGYESPSQFSREYSRMFGLPPKEDINRLRATYEQRIKA
jgi:AraC-like DNA-binding protein